MCVEGRNGGKGEEGLVGNEVHVGKLPTVKFSSFHFSLYFDAKYN